MDNTCICITNLTKEFNGKVALNDLSLTLNSGGIHAIVGSNGAGKSTLFRVLLGVETATSGQAKLFNQDCRSLPAHIRGEVGYVNEEHTLPVWMRVDALLAMQKSMYKNWNEDLYQQVVGYFDVDPKQKISGLSRGERAGLNLAMALAQSPSLLILDEPTLGLDVIAKQSFIEALLFCDAKENMTIIYCSHQMEEIERLADSLIILEKGVLKNQSSPDTFTDRIRHWIVDLSQSNVNPHQVEGLLTYRLIDGAHHLYLVDQNESATRDYLDKSGATVLAVNEMSLPAAVNAFLTKNHNAPRAQRG